MHTLFLLACDGIVGDYQQLYAWLLADLPYLKGNSFIPKSGFLYPNPALDRYAGKLHGLLRITVKTIAPNEFTLRGAGMKNLQLTFAAWLPLVRMVAQDVFCTLERRGFAVRYVDGELLWQS